MKSGYRIISIVIASLHWIFYSMMVLVAILNAETWFFGTKISGEFALVIHLSYGIGGFVIGYFIYLQKRISYALAVFLFAFVVISFRL